MPYGDYYDPTTKAVVDGDVILAADVNNINLAVDAGFEQVADDLDGLAADLNQGGLGPLQALTPSADKLAYYTADDEAALTTITAQARALLDDVTASDQKSTIGLGSVPNVDCTNASNISSGTLADARISGAIARTASPTFTGTVSGITKAMVGLSNVDNTSDASKPISTATQNALNLKAPIASPTFTGTVGGITKAMVGLGNCDNTSDANKPISSATQSALDAKAALSSPTFTGTPAAPTASVSTNTTQIATTAFVNSFVENELSSRNFSFKNFIINGCFRIWQRATSQTASGYGSDDRWINSNVGSTKTHSRQAFTLGQTGVPGNPSYFSRTVVSSVAGANNYCRKSQRIEGVQTLSGRDVTISFYAKADSAKNIAVEFVQSFGTGGSPSSDVTAIGAQKFLLSSSWARYSATVSIDSVSLKTIGSDLNDYLELIFWFDAGSSFNARTDTLGQQSGTFELYGVQIEDGSLTDFEIRPISLELDSCQRYYELAWGAILVSASAGGIFASSPVSFKTIKRGLPGVSVFSTAVTTNLTSVTLDYISIYGCRFYGTSSASGGAVQVSVIAANAEL